MNRLIYRPNRTALVFAPSVNGLMGIMQPHNPMIPQTDNYYETAYLESPYQSPNYQQAQAPIESPIMSATLLNPVQMVRRHKSEGIAYTPTALSGNTFDSGFQVFANDFLR
jgi:hypothetical protein